MEMTPVRGLLSPKELLTDGLTIDRAPNSVGIGEITHTICADEHLTPSNVAIAEMNGRIVSEFKCKAVLHCDRSRSIESNAVLVQTTPTANRIRQIESGQLASLLTKS